MVMATVKNGKPDLIMLCLLSLLGRGSRCAERMVFSCTLK
nr:hypothetical protein [Tanacetum cinerariifolium]